MNLTIIDTEVYVTPVDGLEWIIKKINWYVTETIEEFLDPNGDPTIILKHGSTTLSDVNSDTFTNYEDITEEKMSKWITDSNEYQEIVDLINDEKNLLLSPAIAVKQIPWE